jgi:hypothetical protein
VVEDFLAGVRADMNLSSTWLMGVVLLASLGWAGKQKIIVRLREPLRAETVKIRIPELTNNRGETRDLETKVELGTQTKTEAPTIQPVALKLGMALRSVGSDAVQVTLTLPDAGFIELVMMDFYGKSLATLYSGNMPPGVYPMHPFSLKDGDNNGIKFMTLRINGKMVLKKVMTKVR